MKNLIILSLMATLFTGCATSRIEGWKRLIGGKVTSKKELRAELKKGKKALEKKRPKSRA